MQYPHPPTVLSGTLSSYLMYHPSSPKEPEKVDK